MSLLGYFIRRWGGGIKLQSWYNSTEDAHYPLILIGSPANAYGNAVSFVSVAQGAPGTTVLKTADASNKHKVLGGFLLMSADGTFKFNDGTSDLSGPADAGQRGGFVLPAGLFPYTQTGAINRPLNLITTGGNANGCLVILTEP